MSVTPYANNLDYLADLVELLKQRITCLQLRYRRDGVKVDDYYYRRHNRDHDDEDEELDDSDIETRLQQSQSKLQAFTDNFTARTALTKSTKVKLPLEETVEQYNLDNFERMTLALALAPSIDPSFGNAISTISRGGHTPEIRDVIELLCDNVQEKIRARRYFIHSSPLNEHNLIEMLRGRHSKLSESDFMASDVEISTRLASRLLGEYYIDENLAMFSSIIEPEIELDQVILPPGRREDVFNLINKRDQFLAIREEWGINRILPYGRATVLLFSGSPGTGKTMLAHALAKACNYRLMLVDFGKLVERSEFEEDLRIAFLEAHTRKAILFFDEADELFSDRSYNSYMPTLLREFEKLDGIAILATNRKHILDEAMERRILAKFDFDLPTPSLREQIWRNHLPPETPLAEDVDFPMLAERYEFSGGYIKNAVLVAVHLASQREGAERIITQNDLVYGAKQQRFNRMDNHVGKRMPKMGLDEVVLSDDVKKQVTQLVAAARQRSTVYNIWGLADNMSTGKALTALFVGDSGVGKTVTAEAVASELGQVLYPVNLASVISKYVGETEKNLAKVFESARDDDAVLFFDEADALFSTRLDSDSHHSHYINQQINSLLMQLESYDGIVILATNRADAIDSAFERRLRYRIKFDYPDVTAREAIWKRLISSKTPLAEDVDFAELAQKYRFTGGMIRNVIIRAAFAAATNGGIVNMALLTEACLQEQPLKEEKAVGFMR